MTPKEFWTTYAGSMTPTEFMRLFPSNDPQACAQAYMHERPTLYGIARRGTWKSTFEQEHQHTRLEVEMALATHLEETREDWEAELASTLPSPEHAPAENTAAAPAQDTPAEDVSTQTPPAEPDAASASDSPPREDPQ